MESGVTAKRINAKASTIGNVKAMCLLKIRSRQRRRIIASLGQRPRIREIETPTALKARFTVGKKLDSPTRIEPRFQRLLRP